MRAPSRRISRIWSLLLWPAVVTGFVLVVQVGFEIGWPVLVFNLAYLMLAALLWRAEQALPFEAAWLADDGQIGPDLAHTLLDKGVVQAIVAVDLVVGAAEVLPHGFGLWPQHWPFAAQVVLGLVIAEFGLYWRHRLSHEWRPLWRFHAVHHSATRLWFVNTGRFHVVDSMTSVVIGAALWFIAGAPEAVFLWVSAVTAVIGMLTHCNVDMRCGPLSYLFNTPTLHRWHHSMDAVEGNRNYGENLMLFDILFGTYLNPRRRPPARIGIADPMPATFLGQLAEPFRLAARDRRDGALRPFSRP
ncbi:MAG: sterol desaturase family protein [Rhodospirillales bacterium]